MKLVLLKSCLILIGLAAGYEAVPLDPLERIVGGQNANDGQFPYQISLRNNGYHICGGSIISRNYVVTAAHCTTKQVAEHRVLKLAIFFKNKGKYLPFYSKIHALLSIRAGSANVDSDGVVVSVSEVIEHPNYQGADNDIALLKLSTPLSFTDRIQPIALDKTDAPVGATVVISGWGRIQTGGSLPTRLQYTTVNAISNDECRRINGVTPQSVICFTHIGVNGVCSGDSGGPAALNGRLVGVAGYVMGGCGWNYADGFAKVSWQYEWLRQNSDL